MIAWQIAAMMKAFNHIGKNFDEGDRKQYLYAVRSGQKAYGAATPWTRNHDSMAKFTLSQYSVEFSITIADNMLHTEERTTSSSNSLYSEKVQLHTGK